MQVLGGSWVDINGVISRVAILITHIRGHITPLITAHEPPSMFYAVRKVDCAWGLWEGWPQHR